MYLVGATAQTANPQTYSNENVYIGTDNCLYSNNEKVSVEGHTHTAKDVGASDRAVGSVIWFSGNTEKVPSGYLVCNGQPISRTTYADLYAVIGTKYGSGDGSSTFNVPNLSDGNGRFIRAGFTDSDIGAIQNDEIRNITGYLTDLDMYTTGYVRFYPHGGYSIYSGSLTGRWTSSAVTQTLTVKTDHLQGYATDSGIEFNANSDAGLDGNPMAGHANGSDIHPYNIKMLPLIAY